MEIFDFWSNYELISRVDSNCNSLFKLYLSRENLVTAILGILGIKSYRNFGNQKWKIRNNFAVNFEKAFETFFKFLFSN